MDNPCTICGELDREIINLTFLYKCSICKPDDVKKEIKEAVLEKYHHQSICNVERQYKWLLK